MDHAQLRHLLDLGLDVVGGSVSATPADGWSAPSPCDGWTARDVLSHVTGTAAKALGVLTGDEYAGVPARPRDEAAASVVAHWHDLAAATRSAMMTADLDAVAETPRGPMPVATALRLPIADFATHAWDIAAASGRSLELDPALLHHIREVCTAIPEDRLRAPGLFAPEVAPRDGAGPTERLMAWLGRAAPDAGTFWTPRMPRT